MKSILAGFRDFIARGNAIELAVGVVIGAAFNAVVGSIVDGLINPLIAAIFGQPDLSALNVGSFAFGDVLNAIINFLLVAAAVYFVIIAPLNAFNEHQAAKKGTPEAAPLPEDIALLTQIRDELAAQRSGTTPPEPPATA